MKTRIKTTGVNRFITLGLLFLLKLNGDAQKVYDNFEGNSVVSYQNQKGNLDTMAQNPSQDSINGSERCAKYFRTKQRYDNLKIAVKGKLVDIRTYVSSHPDAPKLKMKLYTTAPVGTLVEIQLGKSTGIAYPNGTNSQYQAYTTVTNAWQELEFKYVMTPLKSETSPAEIDQITLLFNPNSGTNHIYYFDDLTGPGIVESELHSSGSRKRR
jgi:hypothetical protein